MAFSCFFSNKGVPGRYILDPPFREIDFSEASAVRTMTVMMRAAWTVLPALGGAGAGIDSSAEAEAEADAALAALGRFMSDYSHMDDAQRAQMPLNPDTANVQTAWRKQIYLKWRHVFTDTANFLWDVNGTTIGHWHDEVEEEQADEALGQMVLEHGGDAMTHTFAHNVLITPAFLAPGVKIRAERLPTQHSQDEKAYRLDEGAELGSWMNDRGEQEWFWRSQGGAQLWFIRRNVPVRFYVESTGEESVEEESETDGEAMDGEITGGEGKKESNRSGVAAVFIYGNLCLDVHPEIQEQVEFNQQVMQDVDNMRSARLAQNQVTEEA